MHNIKELITVVNQTQLEGLDTRRKLSTLSTSYDRFVQAESDRWGRYGQGTKLLMMEEYLDSLVWLDTAVWRQVTVIQQLHRSLRAGELTEGLYPANLISEIGGLANRYGLQPLVSGWYYDNVPVVPVMIRDGLVTFRVTRPFTGRELYQRYYIRAFDVPIDDSGARARAIVQPDISMETRTGYWFTPTSCVGHRPQLCRAGPRWQDAFPCERGLITGHEPDRKECEIRISNQTETTAVELIEGTFIIQTLLAVADHRPKRRFCEECTRLRCTRPVFYLVDVVRYMGLSIVTCLRKR